MDIESVEIEAWVAGQMSEAVFHSICELHHEAYSPSRTLQERIDRGYARWVSGEFLEGEDPRAFGVRDGEGAVVAVAMTLRRTIQTEGGSLTVLGLGGVATAKRCRGQGLGARLIREAWGPVDRGDYPLCLFQTGRARSLYERLGARVVENRFFNSLSSEDPEANPFSDEVEMIYPASADWPEGPIDLRGPGY